MRIFLRVLGVLVVILGGSLFYFSNYIAEQVEEGKQQVVEGQKKVDTVRNFSALSPYTKDLGGMVADSGQKKIDAGKQDIHKYSQLANQLHLGGVIVVITGFCLIGLSFIPKKNH